MEKGKSIRVTTSSLDRCKRTWVEIAKGCRAVSERSCGGGGGGDEIVPFAVAAAKCQRALHMEIG